jgi:hypothetical protein
MVHYFFNGMLLYTIIIFRADTSKYGDAIQSGTHVSLFEYAFMASVKVENRQQAYCTTQFCTQLQIMHKAWHVPILELGWIIQGSVLDRGRAILFSKISRLAPRYTQPPIHWEPVLSVELHLVPRLRMSSVTPITPLYAFIACTGISFFF